MIYSTTSPLTDLVAVVEFVTGYYEVEQLDGTDTDFYESLTRPILEQYKKGDSVQANQLIREGFKHVITRIIRNSSHHSGHIEEEITIFFSYVCRQLLSEKIDPHQLQSSFLVTHHPCGALFSKVLTMVGGNPGLATRLSVETRRAVFLYTDVYEPEFSKTVSQKYLHR